MKLLHLDILRKMEANELDSTKSTDLANYVNSSANYTKNPDVTTYWDVNKNAWRTFKNNLLVDIIS